jgi:hypothetical protein
VIIKHGKFNIVLRPFAVALVGAVGGLVAWRFLAAGGAAVGDTVAANRQLTSVVSNGDFEGDFPPATADTEGRISGKKAAVMGFIGEGWKDRSRWGEVTVVYADDRQIKRGGGHAQRVEIGAVRNGRAKFCQSVPTIAGRTYHLTLWARSDKPMRLSYGLRKLLGEQYDAQKTVTTGSRWQPLELTVTASSPQSYVMLETGDVGTLWLDDAACVER